jgi:hypothetical protein
MLCVPPRQKIPAGRLPRRTDESAKLTCPPRLRLLRVSAGNPSTTVVSTTPRALRQCPPAQHAGHADRASEFTGTNRFRAGWPPGPRPFPQGVHQHDAAGASRIWSGSSTAGSGWRPARSWLPPRADAKVPERTACRAHLRLLAEGSGTSGAHSHGSKPGPWATGRVGAVSYIAVRHLQRRPPISSW